ncbi:hypothetical protein, partial [Klebsiella aerogenes]|uniref:hypothetical protein n=1 Tax=Klebsiella aerogenes TaxID=548 RepID=UPI001CC6B6DD
KFRELIQERGGTNPWWLYEGKLSDLSGEQCAPNGDGPNALIDLGDLEFGTTLGNPGFKTDLLDEGLCEIPERCLAPDYVGPKFQQ